MTTAIAFENVSKVYPTGPQRVIALDDVTLEIPRGDVFGIVGYSGAGKSTLLRTINALERPTSGRVVIDGVEVSALRGRALHRQRQHIGMIFQRFNLLQSRTVFQNVAYPLRVAGASRDEIIDRVDELLRFVGLSDRALEYPARLSGGQQQRVGIARALANRPDVLLSDEATSALDPQTTSEVLELLRRVNTEYGVTIALVTHEMEVVRELADRVAVMQRGTVVEQGSVYDVFSRPTHSTTRRFVSSVLHHLPDAGALDRIRRVHRGRIVQIHVENRESNDPFLSRIARHHDVDYNVVYGGVSELQARLFGTLTVELLGKDQDVDRAISDIAGSAAIVELPLSGQRAALPAEELLHA